MYSNNYIMTSSLEIISSFNLISTSLLNENISEICSITYGNFLDSSNNYYLITGYFFN